MPTNDCRGPLCMPTIGPAHNRWTLDHFGLNVVRSQLHLEHWICPTTKMEPLSTIPIRSSIKCEVNAVWGNWGNNFRIAWWSLSLYLPCAPEWQLCWVCRHWTIAVTWCSPDVSIYSFCRVWTTWQNQMPAPSIEHRIWKLKNVVWEVDRKLTFSAMVHRPINSLSCLPVDAVTAISFINFPKPFTPFTSMIFDIFSPTVSAGSKSHTSTIKFSSLSNVSNGLFWKRKNEISFLRVFHPQITNSYSEKCSSHLGASVPDLTDVL